MAAKKNLITVTISAAGDLEYALETDNVANGNGKKTRTKKNDTVEWKSEHGHMALLFPDTPFVQPVISGEMGLETGQFKIIAPGSADGEVFKYTIVVVTPGGTALVQDPEIIVDL